MPSWYSPTLLASLALAVFLVQIDAEKIACSAPSCEVTVPTPEHASAMLQVNKHSPRKAVVKDTMKHELSPKASRSEKRHELVHQMVAKSAQKHVSDGVTRPRKTAEAKLDRDKKSSEKHKDVDSAPSGDSSQLEVRVRQLEQTLAEARSQLIEDAEERRSLVQRVNDQEEERRSLMQQIADQEKKAAQRRSIFQQLADSETGLVDSRVKTSEQQVSPSQLVSEKKKVDTEKADGEGELYRKLQELEAAIARSGERQATDESIVSRPEVHDETAANSGEIAGDMVDEVMHEEEQALEVDEGSHYVAKEEGEREQVTDGTDEHEKGEVSMKYSPKDSTIVRAKGSAGARSHSKK